MKDEKCVLAFLSDLVKRLETNAWADNLAWPHDLAQEIKAFLDTIAARDHS